MVENKIDRLIRLVVYGLVLVILCTGYFYTKIVFDLPDLQMTRLTEFYALSALVFLYGVLLLPSLYEAFPALPGRSSVLILRTSGAIGATVLGIVHATVAFFGNLGGFAGIGFLSGYFRVSILLGFAALLLLVVHTVVLNRFFNRLSGLQQKGVLVCVYVAGILILVHAALLGAHFVSLSRSLPQLVFFAVFVLLFLESVRLREWLFAKYPKAAYPVWVIALIILLTGYYIFITQFSHSSVHVHV